MMKNAADAKLIQHLHLTVTTFITSMQTAFLTWKPCHEQTAQRVKQQIVNTHPAPLLFFSETLWLLDLLLWTLGAHRHFTCVKLVVVPVWRLDGQIAADLESLVWFLNSGAGRDPTAHWTATNQPAHICKRPRLSGQTEQSGFVGLELSTGRREDCQDRRREAGAWKYMEHIYNMRTNQMIHTKHQITDSLISSFNYSNHSEELKHLWQRK